MEEEIEKMNTPIEENYYPIHEACKTNNIIAVKHLLPHVDANICSPIGTPLIIACKDNYSELIDLLLRSPRVDPNVKDEDGNIISIESDVESKVEEMLYEVLSDNYDYDWYNNDGGYGTVRINIEEKTWKVDGIVRTTQDADASGDYGTSK